MRLELGRWLRGAQGHGSCVVPRSSGLCLLHGLDLRGQPQGLRRAGHQAPSLELRSNAAPGTRAILHETVKRLHPGPGAESSGAPISRALGGQSGRSSSSSFLQPETRGTEASGSLTWSSACRLDQRPPGGGGGRSEAPSSRSRRCRRGGCGGAEEQPFRAGSVPGARLALRVRGRAA